MKARLRRFLERLFRPRQRRLIAHEQQHRRLLTEQRMQDEYVQNFTPVGKGWYSR